MKKIEIIKAISDQTGIHKVDVLVILEAYFQEIKETVYTGESVSVRNFGTFKMQKRAPKSARDISKGENIIIPERYIPKFVPAKEFQETIKSMQIK